MSNATANTVALVSVSVSYEVHVEEVYGWMPYYTPNRIPFLIRDVVRAMAKYKAGDCLEYEAIRYQGLAMHGHPGGCLWMQDAKCQGHVNPFDMKYLMNPVGSCAG